MATQAHTSRSFSEKVRQIRAGVPAVLAHWGLRSKFTRWRLTQDPGTGLVVLFGVLNNTYITERTLTPFSDYFDPRLLLDLAIDLDVQVESSDSEGFRYAFILDRGRLPAREDLPALERSQLLVGSPYMQEPAAGAWPKPIVVVDLTGLDQLNFESQADDLALAGGQRARLGSQAATVAQFKPFPTLITPNRRLAATGAAPTILAQVEAEVERRKALYQPWPGHPKSLSEPNADNLLKSRTELMLRIRLMLDEYDQLASPGGESEKAPDAVTRIPPAAYPRSPRDRRADFQLTDARLPPHPV